MIMICMKVLISMIASVIFQIALLQLIVPELAIQEEYTVLILSRIPVSTGTTSTTGDTGTGIFTTGTGCSIGFSGATGTAIAEAVAVIAPVWTIPVAMVVRGTMIGVTST